nr:MAG TPA: hypothetical protein [Caudoviricetes sp.]
MQIQNKFPKLSKGLFDFVFVSAQLFSLPF